MSGHLIPSGHYTPEQRQRLRLSAKPHWDVPVQVGAALIHVLAAHPTPPGFDGPEDRNGKRNHDEIRLWADYIRGGTAASCLYDDDGRHGGLEVQNRFRSAILSA